MLKAILDRHPKLCVAPEALFIMQLHGKYGKVTNWNKPKLQQFYHDLMKETRLTQWWKVDAEKLKTTIINQPTTCTFQGLCLLVYQHYANIQGKEMISLLGDKNPTYTLFLQQLMEIYPYSKFIHVIRDPRDNIVSFQKVDFDLNNTAALAYRWKIYNSKALKIIAQYPDRFLLIKYEDLINNQSRTLQTICEFLQVPFIQSLLDYSNKPELEIAWSKKMGDSPDQKKVASWKQELAESDRKMIEEICHNEIVEIGYETPTNKNNSFSFRKTKGFLIGQLSNLAESYFFHIPLVIRLFLLTKYRKITKTS